MAQFQVSLVMDLGSFATKLQMVFYQEKLGYFYLTFGTFGILELWYISSGEVPMSGALGIHFCPNRKVAYGVY